MEEQKNNQLEIDLNHEIAQGTYANLAIIAHSTSEFIIDFVRLMPGVPKPDYHDSGKCQTFVTGFTG